MRILEKYVYRHIRPGIFWLFIIFLVILLLLFILPHFVIGKKYRDHFERNKSSNYKTIKEVPLNKYCHIGLPKNKCCE